MERISRKFFGVVASLLILPIFLIAQEDSIKVQKTAIFSGFNEAKAFKPFVAVEVWGTYNLGAGRSQVHDANRIDFSLRRLRFGADGSPYPWLSYNLHFYADRLGEDDFAFTKGSYGGISIWTAYLTLKILKESDLFNVHAGYYWAAISRQYNSSPWALMAFDKTRAGSLLRTFVTGKSNGIESGVGIGGLKNFRGFGISYRIGTYDPEAYVNPFSGSRLYTYRVMFSFGEPEAIKYSYMLTGNHWGKRIGVTVGFGWAAQKSGKLTDSTIWNRSDSYGTDLLFNYKGLRIDAEYFMMKRTAINLDDFDGLEFHVQLGYMVPILNTYLEPTITYEKYEGKGNQSLFKYIGDEVTYDFGVNWFLDCQRVKLTLHYVVQEGSLSSSFGNYIGTSLLLRL